MERIKSYLEYSLNKAIVEALHEGTRMIEVTQLNEGLEDYANAEIDALVKSIERKGDTPIIKEFIPEIKALVKKFADSGQSGGSAPYTAGAITRTLEKLFKFEPLIPIMNEEEEWPETPSWGSFQNRRLSSLFKESKDSRPYYLNAIVFKNVDKDYTFTSNSVMMYEGSEETVGSRQYVKSFPFEPKTFVIDVIEKEYKKLKDGTLVEEEGGGWWESWLADPKQLDAVWEYYDEFKRTK